MRTIYYCTECGHECEKVSTNVGYTMEPQDGEMVRCADIENTSDCCNAVLVEDYRDLPNGMRLKAAFEDRKNAVKFVNSLYMGAFKANTAWFIWACRPEDSELMKKRRRIFHCFFRHRITRAQRFKDNYVRN